jgi:hypothetical protein
MMGRPSRQPIDLQGVTRDIKLKIRRVIGELKAIEQQSAPIFAASRDVYIDIDIAIHQVESAMWRGLVRAVRVKWNINCSSP